MNPTSLLPIGRLGITRTFRFLALAGAVALSASSLRARENRLELPLVLAAERAELRPHTWDRHLLSERLYYSQLFFRWRAPAVSRDFEPVGLHLDPTWSIQPERSTQPEVFGGTTKVYRPGREVEVPLHSLGWALSHYANKPVLMSARLEKRVCHEFRVSGDSQENVKRLAELLEKEGVEVKLLPHDAFVLLEAPGKERPFPYSTERPRAALYEKEREAWLVKNKGYIAQGLIYQPNGQTTASYPKRDIRIRHVASVLAGLTGKEVFVQPVVEKWDFEPSRDSSPTESPEIQISRIKRQLDKASVDLVELDARSLALVLEGAQVRSFSELK